MSRLELPLHIGGSVHHRAESQDESALSEQAFASGDEHVLVAHARERSLIAIRGLDVASHQDLAKVGVHAPDLNDKDHEFLLERWVRKIPAEAWDEIGSVAQVEPLTEEDLHARCLGVPIERPSQAALSVRFDRESFQLDVKSFLTKREVSLKQFAIFRVHLGKEVAHVALLDIDCEPGLLRTVKDWRSRMERRHAVHLRVRFTGDLKPSVDGALGEAERNGALQIHESADQMIDKLTRVPQATFGSEMQRSVFSAPPLEDHRKLAVVSFDDRKVRHREDAHLGISKDQDRYIDSYYPLFTISNRGFLRGEKVLALAVGREILPDGHSGACQVRRAVVSTKQALSFEGFDTFEQNAELLAAERDSLKVLRDSGMMLRAGRLFDGLPVDYTLPGVGTLVTTELNLNAYHVFAKEMARQSIPMVARDLSSISPELVQAVKLRLPELSPTERNFGLTIGTALLLLRERGDLELFDQVLESFTQPRPFFVLRPGEIASSVVARAKASSLDGRLNQEQWVRSINGEQLISSKNLQDACDLLNRRHELRYERYAQLLDDPKLNEVNKYVGEIVRVKVVSQYPFEVIAPELGVRGYIINRPGVEYTPSWLILRTGEELYLRFAGIHLQSGKFAFERLSEDRAA